MYNDYVNRKGGGCMTDALLKLAVTKNYNKKIQERKIEQEKKRRFKEIFMQYQKNTQKNNLLKEKYIFEKNKKIEELKSQNIHLQKEKEFYKSNLEKVPNFMAKLLKIKKEY